MHTTSVQTQMTVLEHLQELRKRFLWAIAGIGLAMIGGWYIYPHILQFATSALHGYQSLNFTTVGQAFDLQLQVSWWVGVVLASPWWLGQIWLYIAPGLYRREKLYLSCFGLAGLGLFILGSAGGAYLAPQAVRMLNSFTPAGATNYLTATSYVSFFVMLMVASGFSALFPLLIVALNFFNLVSLKTLLKIWRWVVLGAFTFAAVVNPLPSPWPMIVQAIILVGVYGIALGVCAIRHLIIKSKLKAKNLANSA